MTEEEPGTLLFDPVYDHSDEDRTDDASAMREHALAETSFDEHVNAYYESLTPEMLGNGWFDRRLHDLHEGPDLEANSTYFTAPRRYDTSPGSVPAQHPIRAIARMLHEAPPDSVIRVYAYMLTDPYCLDLLVHHGADKDVRLILHPNAKSYLRIAEFFKLHGVVSQRAFAARLTVRVADLQCSGSSTYTQMHDKSIMTDTRCTFGSYNLSNLARCANWESLQVASITEEHIERFDALWETLQEQEIGTVKPDLFPK